ncbi:ESPR-type extended signal peptide-containing protein [Veillonella sp.]|uniref:ESPR-type extended signal peptide-containing protein n=1 Tax=Veillonella sp. TaxID=1926307 RepID=UPI0025EBCD49|nr:ESPR-type extended signal peptide-containing protein [Veillonella sp.]
MNKVYKIIWSRTKNCYVVASELAKSHTKGASTGRSSTALKGSALATAVLATVAVSALGIQTVQAEASTVAGQPGVAIANNGGTAIAATTNSVAIGSIVTASDSNAVAIGNANTADQNSVGIGVTATASGGSAVAIGNSSNVSGYVGIAMGHTAKAQGRYTIALGTSTVDASDNSIVIGTPYTTRILDTAGKVTTSTVYTTTGTKTYATAIGPGATASEYKTIALGANSLAEGTRSISIGGSIESVNTPDKRTITQGTNSIALGVGTQVLNSELTDDNKNGAMATNPDGTKSDTIVDSSSGIAIGYNSKTTQRYGISIGSTAGVTGVSGIAIGVNSSTAARSAVAIGDQAEADSINAVALGNFAKAKAKTEKVKNADGTESTVVTAIASSAIAIGDKANATDQYTTAIGRQAAASANAALAVGDKASATGSGSIAIGSTASSADELSVAIGPNAKATKSQATALGAGAQATNKMALALGASANASGDRSVVVGQSGGANKKFATAIGVWSKAQGDSAVALGSIATAKGNRSIAIGGSELIVDANNAETLTGADSTAATADDSIAVGSKTVASSSSAIAIGGGSFNKTDVTVVDSTVTTDNTTGESTVSYATESTITSMTTKASGLRSIALGTGAQANTTDSVVVGTGAQSLANNAIAIGKHATADNSGLSSIAIGSQYTKSDGSTLNTIASGNYTIAIGAGAQTTNSSNNEYGNNNSIAIGNAALTTGYGSIALGSVTRDVERNGVRHIERQTTAGTNSIAIGSAAQVNQTWGIGIGYLSEVKGFGGTAVGYSSAVTTNKGTAIGYEATSDGSVSVAVGAHSKASNAMAIGTRATATSGEAIAIGGKATASGNQSIALGADVKIYGASSIGIGGDDLKEAGSTVVTLSDANKTTTTLHDTFKALAVRDFEDITSYTAASSGAPATIHLGTSAHAQQAGALAVGSYANARKILSNAIGFGAYADGNFSQAIGVSSYTTGENAIALGTATRAKGVGALALGSADITTSSVASVDANGSTVYTLETKVNTSTAADADYSIAVGTGAVAAAKNAIAVGKSSNATQENSVALGSNATTDAVVSTPSATIAGKTVNFAGGSAIGTVSVGKTGATTRATGNGAEYRTITNVAAGRISADSTDAINGSQLYAVNDALTDLAQSGAGSVTYVDGEGNPVVKIGDKYYPEGTTVDAQGNPVQPDGKTPAEEVKTPVSVGTTTPNSGLGLPLGDDAKAITPEQAKDLIGGNGRDGDPGKDDLLGANGANLSKLATVGDLQAVAQAGLNFTGDTADVTVHRPLSKTLAVTGGADVTKLTDNNIGVVADDETGLAIKLVKDIVLPNGSVTAVPYKTDADGNVVDAAGNPLTQQPDGTFQDPSGKPATPALDPDKAVKLTDKGLDNGGNPISNVGPGTKPTDAVNYQQYQDLKDAVDGIDGNSGSKLVDGAGNEVVKIGDNYYPAGTKVDENNKPVDKDGKEVAPINTSENPISAVTEAPNSGLGLPAGTNGDGSDNPNTGKTPAIDADTAKTVVGGNGIDGDPGKDGLLGANGADLSKLATVGDLQAVAQAGLDFAGDTGDDVHRPLSKKLTVYGEADTANLTAGNIGVVANGKDSLAIKLAKDIVLSNGSVTAPNYQTDADGNVVDANGNPLTQGDDGKWYNPDDLKDLTYDPANDQYVDKDGNPANPTEGKPVELGKTALGKDGITVAGKDGEDGKTIIGKDGLTVEGKDGKDGKTIVGKDGITITPANGEDGATKAPVSLTDKGLDNGGNPISNVAPGTKPTDAATLGQVQELADKVGAADDLSKVDEDGDKVVSVGDKDYKVDENGKPVDKDGNPLVKGDDGKYYPSDATKDDQGNMVVPDGNGGTKPAEEAPSSAKGDTSLASDADKSGLGLPTGTNGDGSTDTNTGKTPAIDEKTAKDVIGGNGKDGDPGKDGLLGMNGADLSKLATVGDLQALAQAGLDFDGDTGTYVHRPLSKKLTVYGEADTANLTAGNIGVVANGKDSLALKLAKDINLPNGSVTTTNYKTDGNGQVVDATGTPLTQGDDGKWYKADDLKDLTYDPVNNQYVDANGQDATPTEATPVETGRAVYDGNGATMTKPAVDSEGNPVVDSDGNPVNVTNKVTADGVDVTDKDGNTTTVKGDGVTATDKDGNTTTVKGDGVTATDKDGNTTTVKGDGITVAGKDGENGKTVVGKDGITITPENGKDVSLTDKGLNNGGNQVKGVGDATDDNDAVNYKQFKDLQNQLGGAGGVGMVDKDGNKVVKGDDGNYYQADENGNVKDADGDSLVKVGDDYYKADDLKKDNNGNIVKGDDGKPVSKDDETKPATPSTPAKAEDTAITSNTDKSSLGRDLGDDAKAISADDAKDLVAGKADENGNRSGGLLDAKGTDLSKIATKGDLQALVQAGLDFVGDRGDDVHRPLSSTLSIKGNADENAKLTDGNIGVVTNEAGNGLDIKLNKDINLGDDGSIKLGDKVNLDGDTGLTVKGDDGKEANYGSDGSTIKDGKGNENKSTAGGNTITDGKGNVNTSTPTNNNLSDGNGNSNNSTATGNTISDGKGNTNSNTAGGNTITDDKGNTNSNTAGSNTITDGNGNKTETKAGDVTTSDGNGNSTSLTSSGTTVTDEAGNQTKVGPEGITIGDNKGNTYVTINQNGLAGKDGEPVDFGNGLNVPGALTVKPATTDKDGNTIAPIIDANGNRIQNVGAGVLPTDAVNVGQLNGVKHDLNNRMNAIGAHAAAMAALHPMEFANGEKTSIAAGIGTFQSKQAMAIGAFYRPNDDTMFSAAGSFGSGENMFNVGVSLRLGADGDENKYEQKYRKAPLSTIAVLDDKVSALEQENNSLKDSVAASNAENESLKQEVAGQKAELQAQRQELEAQREQIKLLMERLGM